MSHYTVGFGLLVVLALSTACSSGQEDRALGPRPSDLGLSTSSETGNETLSANPTDTSEATDVATDSEPASTATGSEASTADTDGDLDNDGWPEGVELDCDDSDSAIYPGAQEVLANGKDDDCDGQIDEGADSDPSTQDEICEEVGFSIEKVPPRMMLLLDFSASMNDLIDTDDDDSQKWPIAEAALKSLVDTWGSDIDFGVDVFPDRNGPITNLGKYGCYVDDPIKMDVQFDSGVAARSFIDKGNPNGGSTPLLCGMKMFLDGSYAPVFLDPVASRYLVVVSDGEDLCGAQCGMFGSASPKQLGDVTKSLLDLGVRTYVIGFGGAVSPDQLDAIAGNGGTGFSTYFDAADPTALSDALTTIAVAAVSCVYGLDPSHDLSDPDKVNLYFDDEPKPLPRNDDCNDGEGWRWTDPAHTAIEFCEDSCGLLQNDSVSEVNATFGCSTVVG